MNYYGNYPDITLEISEEIAKACHHQGSCDDDIEATRRNCPEIENQLKKLPVENLKKELREYGAWSEEELKDTDENLNRILWIACGDITEGIN